jgi:hypothetical protein
MPLSLPDRLTARLISTGLDETEARNARRHVGALTLSKLADGLVDPKLILSWLLGSLGAPAAFVALLVPIREAGALLPQLVIGAWIGRLRYRVWSGPGAARFRGRRRAGSRLWR